MDDAIVAFRCLKALFFCATKDVLGSETGARVILRARNNDDEMIMIKGDDNDDENDDEFGASFYYLL